MQFPPGLPSPLVPQPFSSLPTPISHTRTTAHLHDRKYGTTRSRALWQEKPHPLYSPSGRSCLKSNSLHCQATVFTCVHLCVCVCPSFSPQCFSVATLGKCQYIRGCISAAPRLIWIISQSAHSTHAVTSDGQKRVFLTRGDVPTRLGTRSA